MRWGHVLVWLLSNIRRRKNNTVAKSISCGEKRHCNALSLISFNAKVAPSTRPPGTLLRTKIPFSAFRIWLLAFVKVPLVVRSFLTLFFSLDDIGYIGLISSQVSESFLSVCTYKICVIVVSIFLFPIVQWCQWSQQCLLSTLATMYSNSILTAASSS